MVGWIIGLTLPLEKYVKTKQNKTNEQKTHKETSNKHR